MNQTMKRYHSKNEDIILTIFNGQKGGILNEYSVDGNTSEVLKTEQDVLECVQQNTLSRQVVSSY